MPATTMPSYLKEWIADDATGQKCIRLEASAAVLAESEPDRAVVEVSAQEALQQWHPTFADMQQAVRRLLDHLERYEEQLASLMTERFHLSPRIEVIRVGVGKAA